MNKYPKTLLAVSVFAAWAFSAQCRATDSGSRMKISVNRAFDLDSLPSGSGLELIGEAMYIISDNAPGYFKMDINTKKFQKVPIGGYPANEYIVPKKTKHDLEALVTGTIKGQKYLFAFSSGSGPYRQMLLQIDPTGRMQDKKLSLERLYSKIKKEYDLSDEAMNIEGAAQCGDRLYLLLRKKNLIISMKWSAFEKYLEDPLTGKMPNTRSEYLMLPKHSGVTAGFSGATEIVYKGKPAIMFCASLEYPSKSDETVNVFGSYLGIICPDKKGKMEMKAVALIRDKRNKILKEKIESLAIINYDTTSYNTLIISDNDNGHSRLFEVRITIK